MKIIKTKRFDDGRLNFKIEYKQYTMETIDIDTGKKQIELMHGEYVEFLQLKYPFFGRSIQFGPCKDTADYYRQ